MPTAQRFDWDAPIDTPAPAIPFRGKTPATRHASWTGARQAVHTWAQKQSAYLQLLGAGGALTDNEAAALLRWPLSSVCSVRNAVIAEVTTDGFETVTWDGGRTTKRTRWRLNGSACS